MILYLYNSDVPPTSSLVWLALVLIGYFVTFNAEHPKIPVSLLLCIITFGSNLFLYLFGQDCRVVIWTKNEVGGGSWTSKVKKLCL